MSEGSVLAGQTETAPAESDQSATDVGSSVLTEQVSSEDAPAEEQPEGSPEAGSEEAKPEGDKPEGEEESSEPIEYTDFTAPDGVQFNEDILGKFKERAASKNMSQEEAQEFVDLGHDLMTSMAAQHVEQINEVKTGWEKELHADPNFNEVQIRAQRAMRTFGDESVAELFNSPVGSHPGLVKMLAEIDRKTGEDTFVEGSATPETLSAADTLFDKTR
jgi:hypothetical protein